MRKHIDVDMSKVTGEYNSNSRYFKTFGTDCSVFRGKNGGLKYTLVLDEDAKFINLFGLVVDVTSGDIALGYFPEPDKYILVGNIYGIMKKAMFGKASSDEFTDDELRYILECLKLNPKYFCDSIIEDIKTEHSEKSNKTEYDSVILNLVANRRRSNVSKDLQYFFSVSDKGEFVVEIVKKCMELSYEMQSVAKDFFGNFISEKGPSDVIRDADKGLVTLAESRQPNIEGLMIKYKSLGVPMDLLIALKSYGFGIKQRMSCFPRRNSWKYRDLSSMTTDEALRIGELLSSLAYIDSGVSVPVMIKTYNIMDLLRASNQEQNMLFSIEVLSKYKNPTLYASLSKKYNLEDILLEGKMSEQDFLLNASRYGERYLSLIDRGGMYTRDVLFSQYQFSTYSSTMIMNAGKVFERACDMVIKKF